MHMGKGKEKANIWDDVTGSIIHVYPGARAHTQTLL